MARRNPLTARARGQHDCVTEAGVRGVTIAIAIKVNDGVVLAADSATTMTTTAADGQVRVANIYNNANKVFTLRKGLPIGGITWGQGNIGNASITTLMKDARRRFTIPDTAHLTWKIDPDNYTIIDVARRVRDFVLDEHYGTPFAGQDAKPGLGLIVAGYSSGVAMAEEYEIAIEEGGACGEPRALLPPE